MAKKVLFIDRDGTIIKEAPPVYKIDGFDKLQFYPMVFKWLQKIAELDYELVMVTNQDGLETDYFPETQFWPVHDFVMQTFSAQGIHFTKVFIDKTWPADNQPTRKPGTAMLTEYINNPDYDLANSFVIGDRITDMQLAKNLGCKGFWLNVDEGLGAEEIQDTVRALKESTIVVTTTDWKDIYAYLKNIE